MSILSDVVSGAIKPIANVFSKREDRKNAIGKAKLATEESRNNNETKIILTDKEWEALSKAAEGGTWKDEYVTLIVTAPILMIIIGSLASTMGHPEILVSTKQALVELDTALKGTYGTIMLYTVLAAIGIRAIK